MCTGIGGGLVLGCIPGDESVRRRGRCIGLIFNGHPHLLSSRIHPCRIQVEVVAGRDRYDMDEYKTKVWFGFVYRTQHTAE